MLRVNELVPVVVTVMGRRLVGGRKIACKLLCRVRTSFSCSLYRTPLGMVTSVNELT